MVPILFPVVAKRDFRKRLDLLKRKVEGLRAVVVAAVADL